MRWSREVVCPMCESRSALRINRIGFAQRKLLPWLGIYPWKCGACGSSFLLRRRGLRHSSPASTPAADTTAKS